MSEIKRYDLVYNEYMGGGIGVKQNGKYCLHDDYLEVLKRAETAEQKLEGLSGDQLPIGVVRRGEVDDSNSYPDCRVVCLHDQADWENFPDGTELFLQPRQPLSLAELVPDVEKWRPVDQVRAQQAFRTAILRNIEGVK